MLVAAREYYSDPTFGWLIDAARLEAGDATGFQRELLTALGKIDDPDRRRAIALELCRLRPAVKDGIKMIAEMSRA
jgi:hypothetical protein